MLVLQCLGSYDKKLSLKHTNLDLMATVNDFVHFKDKCNAEKFQMTKTSHDIRLNDVMMITSLLTYLASQLKKMSITIR